MWQEGRAVSCGGCRQGGHFSRAVNEIGRSLWHRQLVSLITQRLSLSSYTGKRRPHLPHHCCCCCPLSLSSQASSVTMVTRLRGYDVTADLPWRWDDVGGGGGQYRRACGQRMIKKALGVSSPSGGVPRGRTMGENVRWSRSHIDLSARELYTEKAVHVQNNL